MAIDWNAIQARCEVIADALEPDYAEVETIRADETALIAFALRHHQSLDWIVAGDVWPMLRSRASTRT